MSTHAKFSPSSTHRWMNCPGSVALTENLHSLPDEENEFTARGSCIHSMGEWLLRGLPGKISTKWGDWVDVGRFNDEIISDSMYEMAQKYHDEVQAFKTEGCEMMVEETIRYNDRLFGTADCILIDDKRVTIIDLKTGHGLVPAYGNLQLLTYAGMLMASLNWPDKKVRLVIIQPPDIDVVKIWDTDLHTVKEHMTKVDLAMKSDVIAAGAHCKWCPVAASCTVKHEMAVNAASLSLDGLSPDAWAEALHWAEMLEPWIKSVHARSTQLATEAGLVVPGYKLVSKKGRLTWADKETAMQELERAVPQAPGKLYNEPTLRTPTQLKKELEGITDLVDELSVVPDRGLALVKESDKREAVESPVNLLAAVEQLELFK